MGQSESLNSDQKRQPDMTWLGLLCQLRAGLLCGAPGKCSAFTELVLSMLKMVITLDGWLLPVLAGVLGRERSEPSCRWPTILQGKGGI